MQAEWGYDPLYLFLGQQTEVSNVFVARYQVLICWYDLFRSRSLEQYLSNQTMNRFPLAAPRKTLIVETTPSNDALHKEAYVGWSDSFNVGQSKSTPLHSDDPIAARKNTYRRETLSCFPKSFCVQMAATCCWRMEPHSVDGSSRRPIVTKDPSRDSNFLLTTRWGQRGLCAFGFVGGPCVKVY